MTVKSADKKPEKYMGSDGKPKIRMVPVDKNVTSEVSKGMVGRYLKKAPASAADGGRDSVMGSGKEKQGVKKVINRITGTRTAVDKMTGKAKVPATEEAEKHVFRFSTKTKQGNIHHSSKDHKSAADAIQKRTGEKVQSMTYKGTVSAMPRRRAQNESALNELTPAQKKMKTKAQGGIRGREGGGQAKDYHDAGMGNIDHQGRGLKKTHKPGDVTTGYSGDYRTAQARKHDKETGKIASIAMNKALRKKDPKVGADSRLSDLRRKHAAKTGRDMQGNKINKEDSDAVKAFLAKGGKIKKLPPAKAQGYHGKDDPGKDMHGVMDKPDTKAMGTRKKVKSMESKKFSDLRAQISESMLGHRDAEKLNGGKSKDPNFKSPESHIDHHHRQSGGHNKSGGDQDRHRYNVAKKLGYDV